MRRCAEDNCAYLLSLPSWIEISLQSGLDKITAVSSPVKACLKIRPCHPRTAATYFANSFAGMQIKISTSLCMKQNNSFAFSTKIKIKFSLPIHGIFIGHLYKYNENQTENMISLYEEGVYGRIIFYNFWL